MRRPALALLLGCLLLVAGVSALDGYEYYQTIEYAGCDQEIYQQDIVVHRTTGTAYEEAVGGLETWHIFVGEHCREDYGDIRFTNSTGAELTYYLWPDYSSSSARFAVRLEGATSAGTLTAHYGNPSAETTSDGDATYEFFDHFDGTEIDPLKWTVYEGSPYMRDGTIVCPSVSRIYSKNPINLNSAAVARSKLSTMGANYIGLIAVKEVAPSSKGVYGYAVITHSSKIQGHNIYEGYHETYTDFGTAEYSNEYYITEIRRAGSTNHYKTTDKNGVVKTGSSSVDSSSNTQGYFCLLGYNGGTLTMDWILVRAYSATPPAATTFSGEQETTSPPATAFTATPTAGLAPLTVQFTDASTVHPTAWSWSFGDGGTSTDQNPQHTYAAPGTYTVTLTATNEYGSDYELKTDYITVYGPITAQFTANVTGGTAPVTVQFTDRSTGGPTSWLWTFGDGTSSTEQNPVHTYTTAGTHTVTLTASHPYDSDTETKTAYITVAVLQPFPGLTLIPRDLTGNGLYTDINGNNRLDYNDLTIFFQNLAWAKTAQPIACFDFNGNGWLDYNDVIILFSTIMEEHT